MEKTAMTFSDRVRFNWGYHDGADDIINGREVRDMTDHFDKVYAVAYIAGVKAQKSGMYTGLSDVAWTTYCE